MRKREPGIERDGLLRVFLGDGTEILAQQHARGEKIAGGGIGGNSKHFSERAASVRVILDLNVANTEDVRSVDISAGKPGLYFFERRNGFGRPARKVIR